jgi:hypothetical protein
VRAVLATIFLCALAAPAWAQDSPSASEIPRLKEAIKREPLREELRLMLARAYLRDGNDFWALRTLTAAAEMDPRDCNLGLWMAWIQIRLGALDNARTLLGGACARWEPDRARALLLRAMAEQRAGGKDEAVALLEQARQAAMAYAEDREALGLLSRQLDTAYLPPLQGRVDIGLGFTSNARAGSPTDPASAGEDASSPMAQLTAWLRFVPPVGVWVRPSVEVEARSLQLVSDAGRDFSYLTLSGRPGLLLGRRGPRVLLAYRYEALLLAGSDHYADGPLWFYESHRGEAELELGEILTLWGGAGWRGFREVGRSRLEVDGGLGLARNVGSRLRMVGALSGRFHDARKDPYDLMGGSLLLSAELRLPRRWSARAGLLGSLDYYPRSAGYFDAKAASDRRDVLVKLSGSVFAPPLAGQVKVGLTYEFSKRQSTAEPYAYDDHRLLAKLIWTFHADPWLPTAATPMRHVPLDYGLRSSEQAERVQDLLRQDEAAQRSSACLD